MFTSWKTALAGIVVIGMQIASIWAPGLMGSPKVMQSVQMISVAAGLLAAKDSNVTGGTKQQ